MLGVGEFIINVKFFSSSFFLFFFLKAFEVLFKFMYFYVYCYYNLDIQVLKSASKLITCPWAEPWDEHV